jgi:acid stress-induced BolA-like protein IbaG/YrbA
MEAPITATDIETLIRQGLGMSCTHVQVEGDGQHWQAVVVCTDFEGCSTLQRHRQVYAILADQLSRNEIHAVALRTFTPNEWESLQ